MLRKLLPILGVLLAVGLLAGAFWLESRGPGKARAREELEAVCVGDTPVILRRSEGTDHLSVECVNGLAEIVVAPPAVPAYDPVRHAQAQVVPPDFGGWVTVWLNGRPLQTPYDPARGIQEPGAYLAASTGRVMMPMRFFTEAFGGQARWNQETREVRLYLTTLETVLQATIGRPEALVNLKPVRLDQPPLLFADRSFVPVRFLAEGLGASVAWDQASRSVRIELQGLTCSHPVYCGEAR